MSKAYGQLLTKHGKGIKKYGDQMHKIGSYLQDESNSNEDRIDYFKKKTNLLSARARRDFKDYNAKVSKMDSDEILDPMHRQVTSSYQAIIDMTQEVKELESARVSDFENMLTRFNNRMALIDLQV